MLKDTLRKGIAQLPDLRNKDGSRVDGTSEPRPRKARCAVATGSASGHVVKAWAIVNDETGRLMLIDVSYDPAEARMESPAIYMTKKAARHHTTPNIGERVVRVAITEI